MSDYLAVIEQEGDSWGAYCPDLPEVGVVGETRAEVAATRGDQAPRDRPAQRGRADPRAVRY